MSNDTNAANQPSYEVGYAKPPRQHRFEKGRSGNPGGRPKGSARAKRTEKLDPSHQPTNRMLLDEAYRPITVREGDQVIELPAIQAVFRAMGVAAMKGNRFAQKTLAELVQKVEDENRATRSDYIQTMIDYKYEGEKYLKHHRDNGLPEPEMLPHAMSRIQLSPGSGIGRSRRRAISAVIGLWVEASKLGPSCLHAAYCELHGLPLKRFGNWRAQFKDEDAVAEAIDIWPAICLTGKLSRSPQLCSIGAVDAGGSSRLSIERQKANCCGSHSARCFIVSCRASLWNRQAFAVPLEAGACSAHTAGIRTRDDGRWWSGTGTSDGYTCRSAGCRAVHSRTVAS